jgi:sulfur transfer complex TusBCD TusB component (DsrH family)
VRAPPPPGPPARGGGGPAPAPAPEEDLTALIASGITVLAVEEDLNARGLTAADLLDGVTTVPEAELARAVVEHDVTLTWSLT